MALPTRKTSEQELDLFNQQMRAQPWYAQARGSMGPGDLSRSEQSTLERLMEANGMGLEGGMHVDAGGNVNQKNRLGRNAAIAAGIAAGGYFAAPAILGAMGAGGAAGGAGAAGAASTGAAAGTAGTVGTVAAGAGGLSKLIPLAGMAGRAMSAHSAADAANRGTALDANLMSDQMQLAANRDNREGESDAWRKLDQAGYIQNWQAPTPTFSPYATKGIPAPSDAQRQAAQLMEETLLKRLKGGGFQPTDVSQYTKPSGSERTLGYLGAGLSAWDALRR